VISSGWGPGGRGFKSCLPDRLKPRLDQDGPDGSRTVQIPSNGRVFRGHGRHSRGEACSSSHSRVHQSLISARAGSSRV
jgi:hypothetical protein